MKEKLEELKKQKERLSDEYDAVCKAIHRIENQFRTENADLYKGEWFYEKDCNWNEFDDEYTEYTFICITDVQIEDDSSPNFSAIKIGTDTNFRMREFSFSRIESMTSEDIRKYTKVSEYQSYCLQNSLKNMLKELFILSPCLKETIKNVLE